MNLYQISNDYQKIFDDVDENGEISEDVYKKMELVAAAIEEKSIAVASYIKNLEAEKTAIYNAKKQMQERENRLNSRIESLTKYLKENMEKCLISEITCSPYFSIKIKKNPPSVVINNENLITGEYKNIKIVTQESIDKIKIKEAIESGKNVPGASLTRNNRLEIK